MAVVSQVYYGAVVNPQTLTTYQALPRCLLAVTTSGDVAWLIEDVEGSMIQEALAEKGCADGVELIALKRGEFLMPGFVDTHTHAPQVPNIGSGQQYQLLDWLQNVTFPMEAKFSDLGIARTIYKSVVRRIINCGTTTCCYYGTLHCEGTKVLADIVNELGQRAFVGKCNMDRNAPDFYVEASPDASVHATLDLIKHIRSFSSTTATAQLVHPILTPRFAISCTDELLSGLQKVAASDPSLAIQTHISENRSEIDFTLKLFPSCTSYAGVYDTFGLLRENTVLAHAVHLSNEEKELVKKRGSGISHCPTSNFNLSSGVANVGDLLDRGIKVGLGTDVSGGFSPSILTAIQHASIASKVVAMQSDTALQNDASFAGRALPIATLLYLATLGGAEVCCLSKHIGSFEAGKDFDALLVSVRNETRGPPGCWGTSDTHSPELTVDGRREELEGFLERFLFCGDDRNISEVYVQGKRIGGMLFCS